MCQLTESYDVQLIDFRCIFAARVVNDDNHERTTHCFRTYEKADRTHNKVEDEDELEMSSTISITDAAIAATAAQGLFNEAILLSADDKPVKFIDRPYPLGLIDPTNLVLEEIKSFYHVEQINQLISIGSGGVADDDIGHLLQLGVPPPSSTISSMCRSIRGMYRTIRSSGEKEKTESVTIDGESWSPSKVTEHLNDQYGKIIQNVPLEVYRRFDMKPVPNVGPNDFLSLKPIGEAADEYLKLVRLSYLQGGEFEAMCWALCTKNDMVTAKLRQSLDVPENVGSWSVLLQLAQRAQRLEDLNEVLWEGLLEYDPPAALCTRIGDGRLLHLAARNRYVRLAQSFMDQAADTEEIDGNGWTALHIAVAGGYPEIVRILIAKANPEKKTAQGETMFDLASKLPDGSSKDEIMDMLGKAGPGGSNYIGTCLASPAEAQLGSKSKEKGKE